MGHGGRRFFLRGIIYYAVSPLHLKVLSNFHPMNMVRRVCEEFLYVVPPLLFGYFVHATGDRLHLNNLRKKPGDFDDEEPTVRGEEEEDRPAEQVREEEDCKNKDEQESVSV